MAAPMKATLTPDHTSLVESIRGYSGQDYAPVPEQDFDWPTDFCGSLTDQHHIVFNSVYRTQNFDRTLEPLFWFKEHTYPHQIRPSTQRLIDKADSSFWTTDKVPLANDAHDWAMLSPADQTIILHVLAFFASSDTIVGDNLIENITNEIKLTEIRHFYTNQQHMEMIHSKMYSLLLHAYAKPDALHTLLHAYTTMPAVCAKTKWIEMWLSNAALSLPERLVVFAAVEAIFFSSSFAVIFYYKNKALQLPGLFVSNDYISRDEGLHVDFAVHLLNLYIQARPMPERILEIICSAVHIEMQFVAAMLSQSDAVAGAGQLTVSEMCDYVRCIADDLLESLGLPKFYKTNNPFPFMMQLGLNVKTNFFEQENSEYQQAICDFV